MWTLCLSFATACIANVPTISPVHWCIPIVPPGTTRYLSALHYIATTPQPVRDAPISLTTSGGDWIISLPFQVIWWSDHHCSSSTVFLSRIANWLYDLKCLSDRIFKYWRWRHCVGADKTAGAAAAVFFPAIGIVGGLWWLAVSLANGNSEWWSRPSLVEGTALLRWSSLGTQGTESAVLLWFVVCCSWL